MPFFVYILGCADRSYYTGQTDDLDCRMAQHAAGEASKYTAQDRSVRLLWSVACQSRDEAITLEKQLQGWSRAEKKALMCGAFAALSHLARGRSGRPEEVTLRQAQGECGRVASNEPPRPLSLAGLSKAAPAPRR